jgi:hypothetical protein
MKTESLSERQVDRNSIQEKEGDRLWVSLENDRNDMWLSTALVLNKNKDIFKYK